MALLEVRDGLTLLVVGTVFASFLIPTSVLLFYFSPMATWRSPLFILNILAIIMGLAEQTLYIYVIINTTVSRRLPTSLILIIVAMEFLVPICVQCILLVRVVSVYPPAQSTRKQNFAIYVPIVALKIARLVNVAYATHDLVGHVPDSVGVIAAAKFVWSTKYVKVEWFLQLFDDMFVSGLFIHKLYVSVMTRQRIETGALASPSSSLAQRLRTLYYIAVSNFIFPILFNIAEIFIIFFDPNFFHGAIVVSVNCYVTIIGVLLATIWANGSKREGSRYATTAVLTSVEFYCPQEVVGEDEDEDEPTRPIPGKIPTVRRGRGAQSPPIWAGSGEDVLVKRAGGSAAVPCIVGEECEERRVAESSSRGGAIVRPEPRTGVRDNAAYGDDGGKHLSVLPSASVREPGVYVAHDPLSDAV